MQRSALWRPEALFENREEDTVEPGVEGRVETVRFVGIDPSSETGIVILSDIGEVLQAREVVGKGKDPKRMVELIDDILAHLLPDDHICIEGFSYGSKGKGISFQFGLGHGIRNAMYRQGLSYTDVSPSAVKKFATGKGNTKKENMIMPIYRKWGFEHESDNVRDAFVIAQIAGALYADIEIQLTKQQLEVIDAIRNPEK